MDKSDAKKDLFIKQIQTLKTLLKHGAISKEQYLKSATCLAEKMGFDKKDTAID